MVSQMKQIWPLEKGLLDAVSDLRSVTAWIVSISTILLYIYWRSNASPFPVVNSYTRDVAYRRAQHEYTTNAASLIKEGFEKFRGPFRIHTSNGTKLVLPSSYTTWARTCRDVDHQQLVREDFFADYSGFEGPKFVTSPDRILIDVVRTKLSHNARSVQIMNEQLDDILTEIWSDSEDWHLLNWTEDTMAVISRISASVFVGPELVRDSEWQKLTTTYTVNIFAAVGALRRWPTILRPLVHHFLPQSDKCREQVQLGRKMMRNVVNDRAREAEVAASEDRAPIRYEDCITWMEETAAGRPFDPGAGQLALALGAIHTTSEAFRQVLLDLCQHPELVESVVAEMTSVLSEDGLTLAALAKLELLDSVMKEPQRFTTASVGIERRVIRDTILPNGVKLSRGTNIVVDSGDMWSPEVHKDPRKFDGYRFLNLQRQEGRAGSAAFVSSTREHNTFGAGKFICPGRFLVANQLKLALIHVLLKYDIRLEAGQNLQCGCSGFYVMSDAGARVEVRRRENEQTLI